MDQYQTIIDSVAFWERTMGFVLIALSLADVGAFILEWREHRKWTRAAKAEACGLFLLVALGLGDWHVVSLQEARERLSERNSRAQAEKVNATVADLQKELAPFVELAQARYPDVDSHTGLGKLASDVEGLKEQLHTESARSDAFRNVTQLSDEALAGSRDSYEQLVMLSRDPSDLGGHATSKLTYIKRELAYYEQPPGIVLALELSKTTSDGKSIRLTEFPTGELVRTLEEEDITNTTRFSLMNDICKKPVPEVDAASLELLKRSRYLPAVAATTSLLRRIHGNERPFLDANAWIDYLTIQHGGANGPNSHP